MRFSYIALILSIFILIHLIIILFINIRKYDVAKISRREIRNISFSFALAQMKIIKYI